MDVYKTFLDAANKQPNKTALIHKDREVKFSEAAKDVNRLANAFKEMGMRKGEKLAIFLSNSIEYVYSMIASLGLGVTVIPLDMSLKMEELKNILSHAEADYLITKENLDFDLPHLKGIIYDIEDLINKSEKSPIDEKISEEDIAFIFYTSGTTGRSKAVPLTYKQLDSPIAVYDYNKILEDCLVVVCYVPLSHTGGLSYLLMFVKIGSTLILGERFSPSRFLDDIETYKVTATWVPPSILEAILRSREIDKFSLKSLKIIIYFGAPASPEFIKKVKEKFGCPWVTGLGLTETAGPFVVYCSKNAPEKQFKKGIMGKVPPWVKVKTIDEMEKELPPGEIGEILVKGYFVMSGYYKEPELTREVLRDGWLYTGDLGYLDEEGYLYITGRKKDVIITGGLSVYANEVEFVISQHQKVKEVAVIGTPDKLRGEVVKAVVVSKNGTRLFPREIISFCKKRLPGYKVPKLVEFKKDLPKTPLGKVKKLELERIK